MTARPEIVQRINRLLADGFGVEDIALKLEISTEAVRRHVRILLGTGWLKKVLRK